MATMYETGHAKNAANFEDLISFCIGYDAIYNPSKKSIQIAELNILYSNTKTTLANVIITKTAFSNATNTRQTAFKQLKKLCTRIINALDATDASDKLIKDAKTINNKIQGKRSNQKNKSLTTSEKSETESKTISVSQQSYDNLIENFAKLIEIINSESTYTPNESDLKITTLINVLTTLKNTNTTVINAYTNYSNAIIKRNHILYESQNGLINTAISVKKYIKSVFGTTSPQFKQISGLTFKKLI